MEYTMIGKLIQISNTIEITSAFKKKEIIISENNGPTPSFAVFELLGKQISKANPFKIGDGVRVRFKIKGKKHTYQSGTIKHFNNLVITEIEAYKIVEVNTTSPVTSFDHPK